MAFHVSILKSIFLIQLIFIPNSLQKENGCKYPTKLQIVFLVDGSLPPSSNWSIIQTEISKEVTKLTEEKYFPDVEFGLAAYYTWNDNKTDCYRLIQPLSSNPNNNILIKLELPGEPGNDIFTSECSMSMALLLAVKDENVKWDTSNDDTIKKIIIAYTLKPSVTDLPNGKIVDLLFRRDAIGDGTDTCENSNPPTADVLRKVLEENKVMALLEVILPFTREGIVGHFYSKTEGSPFYYFTNEVTCTQYYGRVNTVTALSNYWTPVPSVEDQTNQTTNKFQKHIAQVGPGIREEDIKLEDMLKRANILFNKCFMRRVCVNETRSPRDSRSSMTENYNFAGKMSSNSTKLIWKSTSNCSGTGKAQQIVFLVDAALPKGSKWPIIQQEMVKEISMIVQEKDALTEFAVVAYFNWKDMKGKCYNLLQPFTTNTEDILSTIVTVPGEDVPLKDSKCSVTLALILSLHDPQLKWSEEKQKILIAFPLRASHTPLTTEMATTAPSSTKSKAKNIHEMGPRWRVYFDREQNASSEARPCDDQRPPSAEELKQVVSEMKAFVIVATFLPNELEEVVGHSYSAGRTSPFRLFSNELMCGSWYSQNNSVTARPSLWKPDKWQENIPVIFHEIMGLGLNEEDINPEDIRKRALFLIKECFIRNPVLCTKADSKPKISTKPGLLKPGPIQKLIGKQVVFMVDASLSKTSKWPIIQEEMAKEISKLLQQKETALEFALVAYYSWKELKGQCYSLIQTFTTNVEEVLNKFSTFSGGEDIPSETSRCSLTMAIVLAIKDSKLIWSNDKQKIIIAFPLRGSHGEHENGAKGSGFRRALLGDGTDNCENSLPPSAEVLKKVITENNVYLVIATFLPNSLEESVGHSYSAGATSPLRALSIDLVCAQWYSHNNSVTARASLWKPDQWQEGIFNGIMGPGLKEEDIKPEDMKKRADFLVWNCFNKKHTPPPYNAISSPKVSTKPGLFKLMNKVIGKQVVFMADASLSKTSKWPVIQQEMIQEISKILHLKDATMEFALVAYYSWKELQGQCYSLIQAFTSNIEEILSKISTLSDGDDVPSETSKCSLTMALVLALKDTKLLWSNDKQKIVIAFPLRGSHMDQENATKGSELRRTPLDDGSDNCENSLPPSAEVIKKVITENNVYLIIATFLPNSLEESVGHSYSAGATSPLSLLSTDLVCAQWYSHNNSVTARPSLWKPDQWQQSIPVIFHGIMGPGLKEEDIKPEDMKKRAAFLVWNCFNKKFNEPSVTVTRVNASPPPHLPMSAKIRTEEIKTKSAQPLIEEEVCSLSDSELPNLQVLFLVDGSLAHGSNWSKISQDMTKEISRLIQEKQSKSGAKVEFAVAAYFSSHGDQSSGGKCYSLLQPFTKDSAVISQRIGELGHSHTDVYAECSLTLALLLGIKDTTLHWNDELITVDTKATRKFVIAFPMRVSSTTGSSGGSHAKRDPLGVGTDTCENSNPPKAEVLKQVVYTNNVYLLLGTFLLQGKEEQVGKFYSDDVSSPFRLFGEDTSCTMYFGAQNSLPARRNAWMNKKMTLTSKTFKFATSVGLGFKEDLIEQEDILKRANLLYQNCFLPEFISCDWEDPPGYNTFGL